MATSPTTELNVDLISKYIPINLGRDPWRIATARAGEV